MPAVTPEFMFDFESEMQAISEEEYKRLVENLWYTRITRVRPSSSKRERIAWLLSTAMIRPQGKGGNILFEDLVSRTTEYVNENAGSGLKVQRNQLEDLDGTGLDQAQRWSADIGSYVAYWPQKQIILAILNGETGLGYDGLSFFNAAHPYNPYATGLGNYSNVFTGVASGAYPGACPIDDSVTVDQAVINLSKAFGYISSIKMPNGEDPRHLVPRVILAPARMTPRVQQITNAKTIAQGSVGGGGGSADVSAIVSNWGLAPPIEVPEFGANFSYTLEDGTTVTGDDKTFYIACEQLTSSQLGAMVYVDREPFKVTYYTGSGGGTGVDAVLDRAREFEWHCQGRNTAGYGHPYLLFKCKGA